MTQASTIPDRGASVTPHEETAVEEREPHQHEPNIPPTDADPELCEACKLFDAQHRQILELEKQRDAWRDHTLSDKEAQAISACVKALDVIADRSSYGGVRGDTSSTSIARVLDFLAARYGITRDSALERVEQQLADMREQVAHMATPQPGAYPVWHVPTASTQPLGAYVAPGTSY